MRDTMILMTLVLMVGCAGTSTFTRTAAGVTRDWDVKLCNGEPVGVPGRLIKQPDGKPWTFEPGEGAASPQTAKIWIDVPSRSVCLDLPTKEKSYCVRGLLSNMERSEVCHSQFASCAVGLGNIIVLPLSLAVLSYPCEPGVDSSVTDALRDTNAI